MPRNISFFLTTPQFIAGTKDVTRRMGWAFAKVGDVMMAVEKGQGLGKGGKVRQLGLIKLVDVRQEALGLLVDDLVYGWKETAREGFPVGTRYSDPFKFIQFFVSSHKGCSPLSIITRLEFVKLK
jgi:hypothetical protein